MIGSEDSPFDRDSRHSEVPRLDNQKKIPPELLADPPRKVHLRSERRAAVIAKLVFAIILNLPGVAFLVYSGADPFFIRHTPPRPATVVYLRVSEGRRSTTYHVGYLYTLDDKDRRADESVDYPLYRSLQVGQAVQVCAGSFGPFHYVEMKDGNSGSDVLGFVALGLAWNAIFALYIWAWLFGRRRLIRVGTPTIGKIIGKYIAGRNSTSYCLNYRFQTSKGWKQESIDYVPRKVYERVNVGDEVVVVYEVKLNGSCQSDIYDFADFKAE